MSSFSFKGRDKEGEAVSGARDAASRYELARDLKNEGIMVTEVKAHAKGKSNSLLTRISTFGTVSLKEKIFFTSNLATMIDAGLPLSRALEVIKKETRNKKLSKTIETISDDINGGTQLSDAIARHKDVFPHVFVSMVKAGEESGKVPGALKLVGDQLQKTYELRRKIIGAMIYPSIIIIAIIIIGYLMMIFLIPTLAATFEELDAPLPATTRFIIATSDFLKSHVFIVLASVAIFLGVFYQSLKTAQGKRFISFLFLKIPVVKNITKGKNSALMMRTLSSLLSAGVDMIESLTITRDILQNPYYIEVMIEAEQEVKKGGTLSSVFEKYPKILPVLVTEMVSVGEETGKLSDMLKKGASVYEDEVDAFTKNLSTVIEPTLMIFIGAAVGFFAISVIQPMYSIGEFI